MFETDCDEAFVFTEGMPEDNKVKFCCYCGKPIRVVLYKAPEWDDDGEPIQASSERPRTGVEDGHLGGSRPQTPDSATADVLIDRPGPSQEEQHDVVACPYCNEDRLTLAKQSPLASIRAIQDHYEGLPIQRQSGADPAPKDGTEDWTLSRGECTIVRHYRWLHDPDCEGYANEVAGAETPSEVVGVPSGSRTVHCTCGANPKLMKGSPA